jgi:NADH-quinone oxidoreductase subunit L
MYEAIVFLPLLGAILAALIAIAGARARYPGEGPPPGDEEGGHAAHAAHVESTAHAQDAHAHEPAAAGSRTAELITTTLLMISMILSWIAFV